MARILILGGGKQGRVVAAELAKTHQVTVADVRPVELAGVQSVEADLSDAAHLTALLREHDMGVGALPAALGFGATKAAIAAKRPYVDLAFYPEDAYSLNDEAKAAGIPVLPDCGLAPGISNLVVGRAVAAKPRQAIHIEVGGVAHDKSRPYGYVITWAVTDLVDEYTRPARIRRGGQVVSLPVFSELELVEIPGVGEMESFLTDGCRTLLELDVPELTEKTLRWPGHVAAVKPIVEAGRLVEEFSAKCTGGDDVVAFRIRVDGEAIVMVEKARDGLTAMSRTTALTAAAFAKLVAAGKVKETGVLAPERIGADAEAYRFILEDLERHGILLQPRMPFLD